jgi:hypothetical protein
MSEQPGAVDPPGRESGPVHAGVGPAIDQVMTQPVPSRRRGRDLVLVGILLVFTMPPLLLFMIPARFGLSPSEGSWLGLAFLLSVPLVLIGLVMANSRARMRSRAQESQIRPGDTETLVDQLRALTSEERLQDYRELTVRQSEISFRNSQIAMAGGLLVLGAGAWSVITVSDTASRLVLGGLTALGAAFSNYLSATFLRAYERSLQQVNYLYTQPIVGEYLNYALRIASEHLDKTGSHRDDAFLRVMDRALESAGQATANIPKHERHGMLSALVASRHAAPRSQRRSK